MRLRNPRDFWAGVFFIVVGLGAMYIASDYPFGSPRRMGAGFFPTVVAGLLTFMGLLVMAVSFATDGEKIDKLYWRPLLVVLGTVVVYGFVVKMLGIALSLVLLVIGVSFATHESRWKEVAIFSVLLSAFSVLVFVKGLGLPFPIWPAFLG